MTKKDTEWKMLNLKCPGINNSNVKSSGGTDYFVATDFNPLKRIRNSCHFDEGEISARSSTKIEDFLYGITDGDSSFLGMINPVVTM
jgi:hypothetical protein